MGQIFKACAYDIETKICCVRDADKFHANCFAHSGAVRSIHYLLRQKPYRVMWGGIYVVADLTNFSRTEDLLGISTYCNYEYFEDNDIERHHDKTKFIADNSKLWTKINVWDESAEYFDWKKTRSVKYSGYLVNHTQEQVVDLEDYLAQSCFLDNKNEFLMAIDAIPVLTETGGGTPMLFFDGISLDTTEMLAGTWCGDLLQIVDTLPEGYKVINCCFAEVWSKLEHCYCLFGVDKDDHVLKGNGKRFEAAKLSYHNKRGPSSYFKTELTEKTVQFIPVQVEDSNTLGRADEATQSNNENNTTG